MSGPLRWVLALLVILGAACADTTPDAAPPLPDRAVFELEVWPVLVRDCGFSTCHGSQERFFRIVGPGHERLDPLTDMFAPATPAELDLSYQRTRSMIDAGDPGASPLLRKPLSAAAGGAGHEGTDAYGRDVYLSEADPRYQVLAAWVLAPPTVPGVPSQVPQPQPQPHPGAPP